MICSDYQLHPACNDAQSSCVLAKICIAGKEDSRESASSILLLPVGLRHI